jgi:hypothetical protein
MAGKVRYICVAWEEERRTSVTTNIEDGVKFSCAGQDIRELVCVCPQGFLFLEEGLGGGVCLEHLHGGWVEGCFAAFGRGDCEGDLFVEDIVGVSEFGLRNELVWNLSTIWAKVTYQIPAAGVAGVTELVVGGENDEDPGCHYCELNC